MDLVARTRDHIQLVCNCGSVSFSISFRKSHSVRVMEAAHQREGTPDQQIVVCTSCSTEITVTSDQSAWQPWDREREERSWRMHMFDGDW